MVRHTGSVPNRPVARSKSHSCSQHLPSMTNGACARAQAWGEAGHGPDRCRVAMQSLRGAGRLTRGSGRAVGGAGAPFAGVAARTSRRRRPSPPPSNGCKQLRAGAGATGAQCVATQGAHHGRKGWPGTGSPKALKRGWLGQPCATRGAFDTWSFCPCAPPMPRRHSTE